MTVFAHWQTTNKLVNVATNDSARVRGQDRKILPALGTNQIAVFGGFRQLASLEKKKYFYCTYSIKMKILSMICPGLSENRKKFFPSKKNQSVPVAKICFFKTKKSPIGKNKLPQKFRATRYLMLKEWKMVNFKLGEQMWRWKINDET